MGGIAVEVTQTVSEDGAVLTSLSGGPLAMETTCSLSGADDDPSMTTVEVLVRLVGDVPFVVRPLVVAAARNAMRAMQEEVLMLTGTP